MVAFLLVSTVWRIAVYSGFVYSSMACFAIGLAVFKNASFLGHQHCRLHELQLLKWCKVASETSVFPMVERFVPDGNIFTVGAKRFHCAEVLPTEVFTFLACLHRVANSSERRFRLFNRWHALLASGPWQRSLPTDIFHLPCSRAFRSNSVA